MISACEIQSGTLGNRDRSATWEHIAEPRASGVVAGCAKPEHATIDDCRAGPAIRVVGQHKSTVAVLGDSCGSGSADRPADHRGDTDVLSEGRIGDSDGPHGGTEIHRSGQSETLIERRAAKTKITVHRHRVASEGGETKGVGRVVCSGVVDGHGEGVGPINADDVGSESNTGTEHCLPDRQLCGTRGDGDSSGILCRASDDVGEIASLDGRAVGNRQGSSANSTASERTR